jgi:hypothetical protein
MRAAIAIVVALGLVIGWWWTRDASRENGTEHTTTNQSQTTQASPQSRRAPSGPSVETGSGAQSSTPPVLAGPVQERRTLEPREGDSPEIRKLQESMWKELRKFASDVQLTDAQWDQFERDLMDLGGTYAVAYYGAAKSGDFEGVRGLDDDLERELEQRTAAYMNPKQLARLRNRHTSLVTRVRQLYFLPKGMDPYPGEK